MKLDEREDWAHLLADYPIEALATMGRMLGASPAHRGRRGDLVDALSELLPSDALVRVRCAPVTDGQRLALRLTLDGGADGILGRVLEEELKRFGEAHAGRLILDLLTQGSLLLNTERKSYWARPAGAFSGGHGEWSLCVHPALRGDAARFPIPDEPENWRPEAYDSRQVEIVHETSPGRVIDLLRASGQAIDRYPQPVTQSGLLRASVKRWLEDSPFALGGTLGLGTWLVVGRTLGVFRSDAQFQVWSSRTQVQKLNTAPFEILARLPEAVVGLAPLDVPMGGSPWAALHQRNPGMMPTAAGHKTRVFESVITLVRKIAVDLDPDAWFADEMLRPPLRRFIRRWASDRRLQYSMNHPQGLVQLRRSLWLLVSHAVDLMAHMGLLVRGRAGQARVARLSPLGRAVLTGVEAEALTGLSWRGNDRIRLDADTDGELAALAVGSVADKNTNRNGIVELLFSDESIERALLAGETTQGIEARLTRLIPTRRPPARLREKLADCEHKQRRALLREPLSAVELVGLSKPQERMLETLGLERYGDLVFTTPADVEPLLRRLGAVVTTRFDYEVDPEASNRLDDSGELWLHPDAVGDLRFRGVLETWGLKLDPAETPDCVRLDAEKMSGADDLDDAALEKMITSNLRALEPFLAGGVSASTRVRVTADAGLIDAPVVTRQVVLTFPESTALGLRSLDAFEGLAEPIGGGRFLIAEGVLPEVEERLSELGVPFPAEFSSLRDKARMQATVAQLRSALSVEEIEE